MTDDMALNRKEKNQDNNEHNAANGNGGEAHKEIICILCPLGCKMEVSEKEGQPDKLSVRGVQCKQGKVYAYEEYTNPTRILTTTVAIHNVFLPRLPVKTSKPIPKEKIFTAAERIAAIELEGPVEIGTVIIENILDTGADVIATRSL